MNDYLRLDLGGRISDIEGKTLEFKRDLSSPDVAADARCLCELRRVGGSSSESTDDGTVVGVDDPLAEEERIASLTRRPNFAPAGTGHRPSDVER